MFRRITAISTFATILAVAVLLTSCSDGGASGSDTLGGVTVRPLREMQVGDFGFEADQSRSDRGVFHLTTREPMICAIVWGETDRFGHFNNSLDMNGTGLRKHDVYLPGAKPGVAYRFVVQGTTADGTLYRSPVGTFTIPKPAANAEASPSAAPLGANVASSARVAGVSSEYSSAFAAVNALDGNLDTEWATHGDGDDGWVTIDLGAAKKVASVEFLTRSMADGTAITSTYMVTVDGGAALGPFPAGTPANPRPSPVEVTGRILRFDVMSSTGGNVGAIEIRVFATEA